MSAEASSESLLFRHLPHEPNAPALQTEGLTIRYGERTALESVTLSVPAGERLAIVGPNGAGKSTLFKAAAGMIEPSEGSARVFGSPPRRHACIAYLVQRTAVDWRFPVTVRDVVMMGRAREIGLFRRPSARDRAFVEECLERVDLAPLAGRQISELSGGQQQRMFIARALAQEAALMLLDEPFSGLDNHTQHDLIHLLERLSDRGATIIVATHDLDLATAHFDRILLLNRKLIACGPPAEVFQSTNLTATFGHHARTIQTREGLVFVSNDCREEETPNG
ncbi:MAG: metal ABC transporter ATP-binding protein [Kiritimatiellae bacterium]|nr:metal ABC transporter ATP-binding protein [Kiritimatiellia bacterium]MCO5067120.1 metal ABC transporter ATP-binding protein [Kiritimatiellia bacterium]